MEKIKDYIKDNAFYLIMLILYIILTIVMCSQIPKAYNSDYYEHSLIHEIIYKFTKNIYFSVVIGCVVAFSGTAIFIVYYGLIKNNPYKILQFNLFSFAIALFLFVMTILLLSITKDNAEAYIALLGFLWASRKFIPFIYKKIKEHI